MTRRANEIWITDEIPARVLFVKGVSGLDPDCLVAYAEGDTKPLWIIHCHTPSPVCGLGEGVKARRAVSPSPAAVGLGE